MKTINTVTRRFGWNDCSPTGFVLVIYNPNILIRDNTEIMVRLYISQHLGTELYVYEGLPGYGEPFSLQEYITDSTVNADEFLFQKQLLEEYDVLEVYSRLQYLKELSTLGLDALKKKFSKYDSIDIELPILELS